MLEEMLKGLTIDPTINDSAYYNSDGSDAEGNPKIDPKVDTHTSDGKKIKVTDTNTTNRNSQHKLFFKRNLRMIILTIDPQIAGGVAACRGTTHARRTRRDAKWHTCFPESWGCKPDGEGWYNSTGRQHFHKVPQVEFPSSDWWWYHRLPN